MVTATLLGMGWTLSALALTSAAVFYLIIVSFFSKNMKIVRTNFSSVSARTIGRCADRITHAYTAKNC